MSDDVQNVIIYTAAKTAMQSGAAKTKKWILEFKQETVQSPDALMAWNGGTDTQNQVKIYFDTLQQATDFADAKNYVYTVIMPKKRMLKPKSYSENFAYNRKESWTH